jgi:hypothetical protein
MELLLLHLFIDIYSIFYYSRHSCECLALKSHGIPDAVMTK